MFELIVILCLGLLYFVNETCGHLVFYHVFHRFSVVKEKLYLRWHNYKQNK